MLTPEQSEIVLKSNKKYTNIFNTIKYVKESQNNQDIKNCISYMDLTGVVWWKKFISLFSKNVVIAIELHTLRKKVFDIAYNKFSPDLSFKEIKRIIENSSNIWLEMDHRKIKLFNDFCNELLADAVVCKTVCEINSNGTGNEDEVLVKYGDIRKVVINIFDILQEVAYNDYYDETKVRLEREQAKYSDGVSYDMQVRLYNQVFNDDKLLQKEGNNQDGEKN